MAKIRSVDIGPVPEARSHSARASSEGGAGRTDPDPDAAASDRGATTPPFAGFDEQAAIFAVPWRAAAVGLGGIVALAGLVVGPLVRSPFAYLAALVGVGFAPVIGAQVASAVAVRRCHPADRSFWRIWFVANLALGITGLLLLAAAPDGGDHPVLAPIGVAVSGCAFLLAHADAMRRRSGERSFGLDVVQGLMSTALAGCLVFTALGNELVGTSSSWYTLPTAMTFTGTVIGLVWSAQLFQRAEREMRRMDGVILLMTLVTMVNGVGQLAMALSDFTLPAAPLLAMHGIAMTALLLVPLHASRRRGAGLERLAPHEQVRSSRALTAFVLVSIVAIGIEVAIQHDTVSWAVANAAAVLAIVAILATVRSHLAVRETTHLYEAVADASAERQRLLVALLRSMDDDRHRFASQLHQQATASYATFAALAQSAAWSRSGRGELAETSAELRAELARNADALRDLVRVVTPLEHEPGPARNLTTSIRAFVDGLYGNRAAPVLTVAVADELRLDWATEAVVVRILQESIANVWGHAQATTVSVEIAPVEDGVAVIVSDDGRGFSPERPARPSSDASVGTHGGLAAIRTFVDLAQGRLDVESAPSAGTTIRAVVRPVGTPSRTRPVELRAVIDLTEDE